jgi:hypothetical protein
MFMWHRTFSSPINEKSVFEYLLKVHPLLMRDVPDFPFPGEIRWGTLQQFDFEKDFLLRGASIGKAILCVK